MFKDSLERLQFLCETIPMQLSNIDEETFSQKSSPTQWSKKEIIGHLIDSATHHHHRLVRGQWEEMPVISYDQNQWNTFNYYQNMSGNQVISFWLAYNLHLVVLLKNIPEEKLARKINTGGLENVTLEFIIQDYVVHLEHHLRQVVD